MDDKEKKVLNRMQALCSKREYCRYDAMSKALKLLEGDRAKALEIVEALIEEKYVDDLRYASAFAREKSSISGWGRVKIAYALSLKGMDRGLVSLAMEEIETDAAERKMNSVIKTKYKTLSKDPQCRLKLIRFALSRGYEYDTAVELIDSVIKSSSE